MTNDKKLLISHSEVTSYNECELQHFFAHVLNLRPFKQSIPLTYGIEGHKVLDSYYTALKNGADVKEAILVAYTKLDELKEQIDFKVGQVLDLHMMKYFMKYKNIQDDWRIIEVETTHIVDFPDKPYAYAFKPDLLVEILRGKRAGKYAIVDHKFKYNFLTRVDEKLYVQLPRYIWALRSLGYKIDIGLLAQIRYREFKDYNLPSVELFRHKFLDEEDIPLARTENAMKAFHQTAEKITERRRLDNQTALETARPTFSRQVCGNCDFSEVCDMRLNGQSIKTKLAVNYIKSDYGYTREEDKDG